MPTDTSDRFEFGKDLQEEFTNRLVQLMSDDSVTIGEKLKKLNNGIGRHSDFNIDATLSSIQRTAKEGKVAAALVTCPVVPWMDGVFMGYLDKETPLEMDTTGRYRVNVTHGQIARVFTSRQPRDGGRFQISSRFTIDREYPDPVSVSDTSLAVLDNESNRSQTFTYAADDILNQAAGLDFKIAHEGLNLPVIQENGDLLDTYDRLNVVKGLGENAFRGMWEAVVQAERVA